MKLLLIGQLAGTLAGPLLTHKCDHHGFWNAETPTGPMPFELQIVFGLLVGCFFLLLGTVIRIKVARLPIQIA